LRAISWAEWTPRALPRRLIEQGLTRESARVAMRISDNFLETPK